MFSIPSHSAINAFFSMLERVLLHERKLLFEPNPSGFQL